MRDAVRGAFAVLWTPGFALTGYKQVTIE